MLRTYADAAQSVQAGANIVFEANSFQTGKTATHVPGSDIVSLNCPGFYSVSFSGTVSTSAPGTAGVQLLVGGIALPGAEAQVTITAANDEAHIGFGDIIQVCPNTCCNSGNVPTAIYFENLNDAATWGDVTLCVTKLC